MNDFERGFQEELEKLGSAAKLEQMFFTGVVKAKGKAKQKMMQALLSNMVEMERARMKGGAPQKSVELGERIGKRIGEPIGKFLSKRFPGKKKVGAKAVTMGSDIPKPKTMDSLMDQQGVQGYKGVATAMRSPLSQITAIKPPKQTFYKGQ